MIRSAAPRRRFLAGLAALSTLAALGRPARAAAPPPRPAPLSPQDRLDLKRIEDYLNAIHTLQSRFQQFSPDGGTAAGTIYLQRPGKMRIVYDDPVPILIVSDGRAVRYWDKKLKQLSQIGVEDTPAWFLLRPEVRLTGDVTVTSFERSPGALRLAMSETKDPDRGNLTVVMSERPLELRQWTVLDQQHKQVTVMLQDPHYGVPLNELLFFWTRQDGPPG
jgi:outer membrane lipoprotein-sorting protein